MSHREKGDPELKLAITSAKWNLLPPSIAPRPHRKLTGHGHHVGPASEGDEARHMYERNHPFEMAVTLLVNRNLRKRRSDQVGNSDFPVLLDFF